jgi:hypothetical protein
MLFRIEYIEDDQNSVFAAMGFGLRPVGLLRVPETVAACCMPAPFGVMSSLVRMMDHKEEI